MLASWKKNYDQSRYHIKKQRHYFANKGPSSQSYGFSSSRVWMWELGCKESWAPKNWWFWTVVSEKTLEHPLDCKEIKPVNSKGNQSWIFMGMADVEAETPILWPPDVKNWLIWKVPDAGKDWRWEEKGTTKDETVGWHHRLDGQEPEKAQRVADGQGSLACCSPWGSKESDMTEQLNWTELRWTLRVANQFSSFLDMWSSLTSQSDSRPEAQTTAFARVGEYVKSWGLLVTRSQSRLKEVTRGGLKTLKCRVTDHCLPPPKFLLSQLASRPCPECISLPDLCVAGPTLRCAVGETCSSQLWRSR